MKTYTLCTSCGNARYLGTGNTDDLRTYKTPCITVTCDNDTHEILHTADGDAA